MHSPSFSFFSVPPGRSLFKSASRAILYTSLESYLLQLRACWGFSLPDLVVGILENQTYHVVFFSRRPARKLLLLNSLGTALCNALDRAMKRHEDMVGVICLVCWTCACPAGSCSTCCTSLAGPGPARIPGCSLLCSQRAWKARESFASDLLCSGCTLCCFWIKDSVSLLSGNHPL